MICSKFQYFIKTNLRLLLIEYLARIVKLDVKNYDIKQLINLCQLSSKNKYIDAGNEHSLILMSDGRVYGCGSNEYGQLGFHNYNNYVTPVLIPKLSDKVIQLAAGYKCSSVLTIEGNVYSFGNNYHGQLGFGEPFLGSKTIHNIKINSFMPYNVIHVSADNDHSLILTNDGYVYTFGDNECGQLGLGDKNDRYIPTLIQNLIQIIQVSGGSSHSLVLTNNYQIYAFGDNVYGQLGLGCSYEKNIVIPRLINGFNDIIDISAGADHSLFLTETGQIYSCGDNEYGNLGLGNKDNTDIPTLVPDLYNIISISAGNSYSLVLMNNGQVYAFGSNYCGELGLGICKDISSPRLIKELVNIINISAKNNHSLALTNNGQIYAFGNNEFGQLGLGDFCDRDVPTLLANFNIFT